MQRPVVVLPQPDSPTRPSVSPRRMEKLTPSTALTRAASPPKMPPPMGKCLTRFRTSRIGASVTRAPATARRSDSQQAAVWASATVTSSGRSTRHRSTTKLQRGAKAQPGGSRVRSGG